MKFRPVQASCHPVQCSPNMRVADCVTVWVCKSLQLIYLSVLHLTLDIYIRIYTKTVSVKQAVLVLWLSTRDCNFLTWMVANCWINWHLTVAKWAAPSGLSHRLCCNKRAVRICVVGCVDCTKRDPSLVRVTLHHSHIILQSITGNLASGTM